MNYTLNKEDLETELFDYETQLKNLDLAITANKGKMDAYIAEYAMQENQTKVVRRKLELRILNTKQQLENMQSSNHPGLAIGK